MPGYTPIDLSNHVNAGPDAFDSPLRLPTGDVLLRGLPFRIGAPGADRPYVRCGPGGHAGPMRVDFPFAARTIVVAHLLLHSDVPFGGAVGLPVADYTLVVEDGASVTIPIRESFEIGALYRPDPDGEGGPAWRVGTASFLAAPDVPDSLHARDGGPWSAAGRRMIGVDQGFADGYRLWTWRDPDGRSATGLEVRPTGAPFIVAGITVGELDEDPIVRTSREPIRITLLDPAEVARGGTLETVVDRGLATYTWPILPDPPGSFLARPVRGWGEPPASPDATGPAYAQVAATPSATVEIQRDGRTLGAVRWGDVTEHGSAEDPGRVRIEWVDRTRQWVHTTVVDEATGRPVPCRIHFRSPAGIPWQPHGHHDHVNDDLPSWHMDVGGDVRLGAVSYAVVDGRCQGWLPEGDILVDVVRGFEYEPLRTTVRIEPGQRELTLTLRRWADERARGWVSGDTHVHFLSVDGGHAEAAAEDLHVVNLLQAQWGHLFTNTEDFTGRPSVAPGGETIVHVGQENRQHVLGHLGLLGLREPVMPWSSDGPNEAEIGGALETTLSHWADEGHARGALVTLPHFAYPNGETATLIATGRIDAIEMIWLGAYFHREYYRYLDAGYRLPLVGGTDKMTSEVPVGIYRTYARLADGEPFTYDAWTRAVRAGRTYLSAGPILRLEVDGAAIGDTIAMPAGGGTVEVAASSESAAPFESLQLVVGGQVVAEATDSGGTRRLEIRERVRVPSDSWIALRAGGPGYFNARRTLCSFERGVFAHTSPIYLRSGPAADRTTDDETLEYLLTRVDAARAYVETMAPTRRLGGGGHPHGEVDHLAHLVRPFDEARVRLRGRRRGSPDA
jgi:hypothetical protein